MNIRNFTAHPICFYREEDVNFVSNIRKYVVKDGAEPYLVVESEGMLSVEFENNKIADEPVPIYTKLIVRSDRLPKTEDGDMIVVSAMYGSHRGQMDTAYGILYCVKDTVYDLDGKPIGCLGLVKV